jgi:hypothetical protein
VGKTTAKPTWDLRKRGIITDESLVDETNLKPRLMLLRINICCRTLNAFEVPSKSRLLACSFYIPYTECKRLRELKPVIPDVAPVSDVAPIIKKKEGRMQSVEWSATPKRTAEI